MAGERPWQALFQGAMASSLDPPRTTGARCRVSCWRSVPRPRRSGGAGQRICPPSIPDEELDKARTIDLTATELAESAEVERRMAMIGGADCILFDMGDGLERIAIGKAQTPSSPSCAPCRCMMCCNGGT